MKETQFTHFLTIEGLIAQKACGQKSKFRF